jgi:hypothetical protein
VVASLPAEVLVVRSIPATVSLQKVCFGKRERNSRHSMLVVFMQRFPRQKTSRPGLPDFSWYSIPKRENIPKDQLITYTKETQQYISNGHIMYPVDIKFTIIFCAKAFKIYKNLVGFLV